MLLRLTLEDFALASRVDLRFEAGLNLLTGETGAGKSIIVEALGLCLGERASADQVRSGSRLALVEAEFSKAGQPTPLVLRREVSDRGRSSAWINGEPAALSRVRQVAAPLAQIHGQNQQAWLLEPAGQLELLDRWLPAQGARLKPQVAAAWSHWRDAQERLAGLRQLQARGLREQEYLRSQLEDLKAANLRLGEEGDLEVGRARARHLARLQGSLSAALEAIVGDGGAALTGAQAEALVRAASQLDDSLAPLVEALSESLEGVHAAAAQLRRYLDVLEIEPGRLDEIEARLEVIERVKLRFGGSVESALAELDRLSALLDGIEDLDGQLLEAQDQARLAGQELAGLAHSLSQARLAIASEVESVMAGELWGLGMPQARFEVALRSVADRDGIEIGSQWLRVGVDGIDECEFRLSANAGEPTLPLLRVASGGELSRVMLALRAAAPGLESAQTAVFDEVDSGIGGVVGDHVGARLKSLSDRIQVLVVTHLAQVACYADHHLMVEKGSDGLGRTEVVVRPLESAPERARELARMMSGKVTQKAVARALELLDEARRG